MHARPEVDGPAATEDGGPTAPNHSRQRTALRAAADAERQVVVPNYGRWQRHLGGDSSVRGRTIPLDGWGSQAVGVLPPDFRIALH